MRTKHASDRTTQGFRFEKYLESLDCPKCGEKELKRIPMKNFGHIDAVCFGCGAGVSAKFDAGFKGEAKFKAPPASQSAYRSVRRLWGDEKLFVLAGNTRKNRFFSYVGAQVSEIAPRRGEAEGRIQIRFTE